ncbi:MAG: MCE family protein [Planctomycetes bacterium]|nr:MCE family protein [Planctomycetota bacterium]
MNKIQRDTLLGLVFFGTLAFLLWATVNLTDLSMSGVDPIEVWFENDAGGAQPGTNVMVLGKRLGKVTAVDLLPDDKDHRVRMTLRLQEPLSLRSDCLVRVEDSGVLGGKQLYVDPGRGAARTPGQRLVGVTKPSAFDRVGDTFDGQGPVGSELKDMLISIKDFFNNMNDRDTSIGRLVRSRELYDELLASVQSFKTILQGIQNNNGGTIGRLVMDTDMGSDVKRLLKNLADVSDTLRGSDGTVGMLLNDRTFAGNLRDIVADVRTMIVDTRDGKGAVGMLLRDELLAKNLGDAVQSLADVLKKANDPTAGALGTLTSDPDLARDFKLAVANLADVSAKLRDPNAGPLGMLIADTEAGVRLRRIFTQVSRAIEDAREAAPIGTFVQVLMGAF